MVDDSSLEAVFCFLSLLQARKVHKTNAVNNFSFLMFSFIDYNKNEKILRKIRNQMFKSEYEMILLNVSVYNSKIEIKYFYFSLLGT